MKKVQELIDICEENEENLTDWERDFVDSVANQLISSDFASNKQVATLERIASRFEK